MTKKTADLSRPLTSYVETRLSKWHPANAMIKKLPKEDPTALSSKSAK